MNPTPLLNIIARSDRIIIDNIHYVKIKRWRIIHMAGWQLSEGRLEKENISQDEFWNVLKRVFSNKSKNTTSYKYCFFKSLLDNLFNCDSNYSLTFEQIFETSAEIYWNLVFMYGINQAIQSKQWEKSKIKRIIEQIVADYGILESTPYEFICADAKITMHKKVRTELRKYVI